MGEEAKDTAEKADDKKKKDKKEKKPAKEESAGISPAERAELEKLKTDLIARKAELKAQGMSGGQQNKDAQVMEWVKRMTELKEKAGELAQKKDEKKSKKKGGGDPEALKKLKEEIEDHKLKLKTEFGYTKSDINKDEDIIEMTKRLNAMKA